MVYERLGRVTSQNLRGLASNPHIRKLALDRGLDGSSPLQQLQEYAVDFTAEIAIRWEISTLESLADTVAAECSASFDYIRHDSDLSDIAQRYRLSKAERALLRKEFLADETEGVLLRPDDRLPGERDFLIVVDARGDRRWRAYFTLWHELTHLIVTPPANQVPVRRYSEQLIERDPVEQAIDHITGHLAFFEPLFRPVMERALRDNSTRLAAIETACTEACPEASFYAAALAALRFIEEPTLFLQIGLAHKRAIQRELYGPQFRLELGEQTQFPDPDYRAIQVIPNQSARGFRALEIRTNMRTPSHSILTRMAESSSVGVISAVEDQSWWETSSGGPLGALRIRVESLRRGRFVYGLILPEA